MTERSPSPSRRRPPPPTEFRFGSRRMELPQSAALRIALGSTLIVGGVLGFMPILGFWMIPLGIAILAADVPAADRLRRKGLVWLRGLRRRLKRPRS